MNCLFVCQAFKPRPNSLIETAPRNLRFSFAPPFNNEDIPEINADDALGVPLTALSIRCRKNQAVAIARAEGRK